MTSFLLSDVSSAASSYLRSPLTSNCYLQCRLASRVDSISSISWQMRLDVQTRDVTRTLWHASIVQPRQLPNYVYVMRTTSRVRVRFPSHRFPRPWQVSGDSRG